jgi:hypothetical protein
MKRIQVYMDESTHKLLKRESKTTGKTISELIRESIKGKMNRRVVEILRRTEDVYGIWKDRKFDVEKYVKNLRRE